MFVQGLIRTSFHRVHVILQTALARFAGLQQSPSTSSFLKYRIYVRTSWGSFLSLEDIYLVHVVWNSSESKRPCGVPVLLDNQRTFFVAIHLEPLIIKHHSLENSVNTIFSSSSFLPSSSSFLFRQIHNQSLGNWETVPRCVKYNIHWPWRRGWEDPLVFCFSQRAKENATSFHSSCLS